MQKFFISLGGMPRSGIAGSYNCSTRTARAFSKAAAQFYKPHQQCMRVPVSPRLHQDSCFYPSLITASTVGVRHFVSFSLVKGTYFFCSLMCFTFEVILRNTRQLRNKGIDLEFFFLIYCPELAKLQL